MSSSREFSKMQEDAPSMFSSRDIRSSRDRDIRSSLSSRDTSISRSSLEFINPQVISSPQVINGTRRYNSSSSSIDSNTLIVIFSILAAVITILLVLVSILVYKLKKKQTAETEESPFSYDNKQTKL